MEREIKIININDVTPKYEDQHPRFAYAKYELIPKSVTDRAKVAIYEIPPLKSAYPYHYHSHVDEIFYIIAGHGSLKMVDGVKEIKKGDLIYCPSGESGGHLISNDSEIEPLIYIDIDTVSASDVVFYPDSNKLAVLVNGCENKYYRQGDTVEYYDGE